MKITSPICSANGRRLSFARLICAFAFSLLVSSGALAQTYAISTLAGTGAAGSTDTAGGTPTFNTPEGVTVDSLGNVYVADAGNSRIRKITGGGVVTTLASTGFNAPAGVAVDSSGNVFVADTNNHVIKKVDSGGVVTVVAGSSGVSGASVAGPVTLAAARFASPVGIATNSAGTILYVADTGNHVIRLINIGSNEVTTIAGTQGSNGAGAAQLDFPTGIVLVGTALYVADRENHVIRKIDLSAANAMTVFAGALDTTGTGDNPARFNRPMGIAADGSGNLFVSDFASHTIRRVSTVAVVSTIAGLGGVSGATDGVGNAARFTGPWGIAVDSSGNIYVGDSNNQKIRKGTLATAPVISVQPANTTFTIGVTSSATFSVTASGSPTYQWQRAPASNPTSFSAVTNGFSNGLTISGANTSTLTITSATAANNGDQFRVFLTNGIAPDATSNAATLSVGQQLAITSANNATFTVNNPGTFTVTATGSPAPTFSVISGTFPSLWASEATFQSTGVISGTPPNSVGSPFNFTIQASNGVGTPVTQNFTLTVGTTVPPTINVQPTNYSVPAGQTTANFSISASANPAIISYQWQRQAGGVGSFFDVVNGSPAGVTYSGANTASLSISQVSPLMNGDLFRVVVSNGATTTSSAATLTVPPAFTTPANTTFSVNQSGNVQIFAIGTPTPVISQSGVLPTGITFSGGTGSAFIFADGTTPAGNYSFSLQASNSGGTTTQNYTVNISPPQAPSFTNASSTTFVANQSGTFTFTGTGSPTPTFAILSSLPAGLQFNSPILSGVPATAEGSPHTLIVTATNASGTAQQTFTLNIQGAPPTITANPDGVTANVGGTATFTAAATGFPTPSVRWQRQPGGTTGFIDVTESATYGGTQTGTLTVNNIQPSMSGDQFRLTATNNGGSSSSLAAILNVNFGTAFTTFAGLAPFTGSSDGTGTTARFNSPSNIAFDFAGNLYVADTANHVIRKISSAGAVTTLAGLAGASGNANGTGIAARFNSPQGVAVDSIGNVYVADTFNHTIRVIATNGAVSTLAGSPGAAGAVNDVGSLARFSLPTGIVIDPSGTVYVSDTNNHAIRQVLSNGTVSTYAGAMLNAGYVDDSIGTSARFNTPVGLRRDGSGNLFVADSVNHVIRRIALGGSVSTVAGLAGNPGSADGNTTNARFNRPSGVAVDSSGNVYVADTLNSTVRKISSLGDVTTVAGSPGQTGSVDSAGGAARFNQPFDVAVDISGNVFVADTRNHTIRRSGVATPPVIATQPTNRVAAPGQSVTFNANATGSPAPGYQWQRQAVNTFGFTNLPNSSIYSGTNTNALTIAVVTSDMNGDQFRVVANNGVLPVAESTPATLTIGVAPVFTSANTATFQAQQAGSFTVTTTSTPAATYSATGLPPWASINADTGQITGTPPDTSGSPFTVIVSANNGVIGTQTLTITVTPAVLPPTIATQPAPATVDQGQTATFTVSVTGTAPFAYQWRRNGAAINGATGSTLQLANVQPSAQGVYSVAITNVIGSAVSNGATLAVNSVPVITLQPSPQIAQTGTSATFSVAATGGGLSYQWRRNGAPIAGANGASLTLSGLTAADAGNFDVLVSNGIGFVNSSLAQLTIVTVPTAPVITSQPAARTIVAGGSVTFAVGATGAPGPSYQWRKNGAAIAGANAATFGLPAVQAGDAANYDVVVSNSAGSVTSGPAGLTVISRSFAGYYFGSFGGGLGDFAIYVRDDNTGVYLAYLPGSTAPVMTLNLRVNDAGQFSFSQGAIATAGIEGEPQRAAALQPVTVSGTLNANGTLSGAITGGANGTFTGERANDTGGSQAVAGFYQAGAAANAGTAYTIAGPNNVAFVVVQSGNTADGGRGAVTNSGVVTVTSNRSVITEIISPSGTLEGTSTGAVSATFAGASEAVLARQRLVNISSRARVAGGDAVAIAGFVISGEESKPVLIRAVGPTIGAAPFNVPGALAAPRVELFRGNVSIAVNSGVGTNRAAIDAAGAQAAAFPLGAAGTDAAILTTLAPGNYTAIVSSTTTAAGVALVEVYDLSGAAPGQKLLNIATRAAAGTGTDTLIAGFVVPPGSAKRVLVRGVGPGLTPFGVTGVLAQPALTLFSGSSIVAQNTNWSTSADAAAITTASSQAGAFPLTTNDSALVVTLAPGNYTAQVTGVGAATGVALIEVYELP